MEIPDLTDVGEEQLEFRMYEAEMKEDVFMWWLIRLELEGR